MKRNAAALRHGSLFSGIGGFDLAAQWMGWQNVFHCEINEFCNRVLQYYWPKAVSIKNIIGYDWKKWKNKIDVLSGGFPCQPFSLAGKRLGDADQRHLWPAMLAAIRAIRPPWVVGENVRGLVSWHQGLVFEQVHADLETEGYEVLAAVLPAAGIGAPHRRERVFFIAHAADAYGRTDAERARQMHQQKWETLWEEFTAAPEGRDAANANSDQRREGRLYPKRPQAPEQYAGTLYACPGGPRWKDFPTQPPLFSRNDGLSCPLDGITVPRWLNKSTQSFGNAVVPPLVYRIFSCIGRFTDLIKKAKQHENRT